MDDVDAAGVPRAAPDASTPAAWRYGVATGACVALQMLSSIYYGIFLVTLLRRRRAAARPRRERAPRRRVFAALAAGGAAGDGGERAVRAAVHGGARQRRRPVGGRRPSGTAARASSYRAATPGNWLYGGQLAASVGDERRLFPGFIPLVLAMVGLLLRVPGRRPIVYLLLLVAAFEMSLGLRGYSSAFMYEHVPLYRGLRALARLGIFVVMFLAVLAGYGYALLVSERSRVVRSAVAAVLVIGLLAEYRTAIPLEAYPNAAPPVYRFLATQPRGIVAEFPVPQLGALPGYDAEFAYLSTFHWFPLVNGYSGMYPPSYLGRLDRLSDFPGPGAIEQLRRDAVRYVIVHVFHYPPPEWVPLLRSLDGSNDFIQLGRFDDGNGPAIVYRLR